MKKSLVGVVLLGIVLTLGSCGDDPDPISPIVGTWSRVEYEFTGLPTGFTKYWEGYSVDSWGESGYTFVFKSDGTYTRAFTLPSPYNIADKGKYTLDGSALKVSPDNPRDLDLIEDVGFPGIEFTVVGEISDIRMQLSRVMTLSLPSDAAVDAAAGDLDAIPDSEYKAVDVTLVYKFDKLQ
ncbi:MAG TPA: hypothetical protein VFE50_17420 [Cyclobacteriaceae bacterium]|nr:hypothetical protein [Cyclobacteriaceae bacterium]